MERLSFDPISTFLAEVDNGDGPQQVVPATPEEYGRLVSGEVAPVQGAPIETQPPRVEPEVGEI